MKWLYIIIGMLIIFYVGRTIEYVVAYYNHEENSEITIIKSGAQP
jgi:hypothetical protein